MSGRTRKKSRHGYGRKPRYKDLVVAAAHGQICDTCDTYKPLTDFYRTFAGPADRAEWSYRSTCKKCCIELDRQHKQQRTRAAPAIHRPASFLLGRKKVWPTWWNTGKNWTAQHTADLKVLVAANAPLEASADALERSPTSIAWRARELALELPPEWSQIIAPKRVIKPRVPRFILKYPYLAKARPSDDDLLRVNALVPHHFPDWMRADIAQSVLLAFFEGDVSIAELESHKGDMRWFYKRYYREQAPREEIQISGDSDDTRSYDDIAISRKYYQTLERHEDANQIQYVWNREHAAARFLMAGRVTNMREIDDMLESGEIKISDLRLDLFRPWDRVRKHARARLRERWGIELSRDQAEQLIDFCRKRQPEERDRSSELHILRSRNREIPIIYNRGANEIVSVLPEGGSLDYDDFRDSSTAPSSSSAPPTMKPAAG